MCGNPRAEGGPQENRRAPQNGPYRALPTARSRACAAASGRGGLSAAGRKAAVPGPGRAVPAAVGVAVVSGWARSGPPGGCQRYAAAVLGRAGWLVPAEAGPPPPPQPGPAAGGGPAADFLRQLRQVLEEQAAEAKKSHFGKETGKS